MVSSKTPARRLIPWGSFGAPIGNDMIEAPRELEELLIRLARETGVDLIRDASVELTCDLGNDDVRRSSSSG
jgi:hypothetical protein